MNPENHNSQGPVADSQSLLPLPVLGWENVSWEETF